MRASIVTATLCALIGLGVFARTDYGQDATGLRVATASPAVESKPKFRFILFWKENNPATQSMVTVLKSAVEKRSDRSEWTSVNVSDPNQRAIVERYQVSRAPMPLVICVAPNSAIIGAVPRQLTDEAIERLIVTPAMADVTKALQDKKIVLVHVKKSEQSPVPFGVVELMADMAFKERTTLVGVGLADPAESRFVTDMEIKPTDVDGSMLVVFGPPGVFVGKFPANVTKDQIAAALHAAGKCCDDPNCKHNQKGQ
jgi:hypothetical protein